MVGEAQASAEEHAMAMVAAARARARGVVEPGERFLAAIGGMTALALEGLRKTWDVKHWWREWLSQAWFLTKVTALPVLLVAIPVGATISLQVGQLVSQLGAQSFTGTAVVVGLVREVAPIVTALLISGAGGSAMAADMGSRHVRDELAAMQVMAVNPVHRLVTPRLWAASTVGVLLVSLVVMSGVAGGFFFNVVIQGVTPGAYFNGATSLLATSDLVVSLFKAFVFGFIAATVACYKGMNCDLGPVGVGRAVNKAVVETFILVFITNYVITTLYFQLVPPRI
jgi:phospholipid/cholesterol/gamma-HCH transport system permease protein